jgi:hypothetical protein
MAFFDDVYKKLFGKKAPKNSRILHEKLTRSDSYARKFEEWINGSWHTTRLSGIRTSYELKKKGIEQNPIVHVMNNQYACGFAISYTDYFNRDEFSYMLDHLSEKLLKLDYKLANSDLQITDKGTYTETVEKKYLKPRINVEPPIDQKYGNILIENVLVDDKPSYFKLSANIYSDRLYTKARSFDELVEYIFEES